MWGKAIRKHHEQSEKSAKIDKNLKGDNKKTELEKNQKKLENIGEMATFKKIMRRRKVNWQTKKASKWRPPVTGLIGLSEKSRLLGVDFYTEFYGFHEIRTENDIEHM